MSGCDNKLAVAMKLKDKDMSHTGIIWVLHILFHILQKKTQTIIK